MFMRTGGASLLAACSLVLMACRSDPTQTNTIAIDPAADTVFTGTRANVVLVGLQNGDNVIWTAIGEAIQLVDSTTGQFLAVQPGVATLKAHLRRNPAIVADCVITVLPALSIQILPGVGAIAVGSKLQQSSRINGSPAPPGALRFRSSSPDLLAVDFMTGLLTALQVGGPITITAVYARDTTQQGRATYSVGEPLVP